MHVNVCHRTQEISMLEPVVDVFVNGVNVAVVGCTSVVVGSCVVKSVCLLLVLVAVMVTMIDKRVFGDEPFGFTTSARGSDVKKVMSLTIW